MRKKPTLRLFGLGLLVALTLLTSSLFLSYVAAGPAAHPAWRTFRQPGPDLVVESITVDPLPLEVGQPATITVIIKNQGDAATGNFKTFLYVDPTDRPPTLTTPDTAWTSWFSLGVGERFTWRTIDHTFATAGCDHAVYAWVDRDDAVDEGDETNNLGLKSFCVGATPTATHTPTHTPTYTPTPCQPDPFEPDDTCPAATDITTDGVHQVHNLCPVGDQDWVRFQARAGITYTMETSAVGPDGDTVLTLFDGCGGNLLASADPISATTAQLIWPCTDSGLYYAQVDHAAADYGPAAGYDLSVIGHTDCPEDIYEDDDTCAAARDVTANGAAQTHIFCAARDHDWVKLNATSGSTVIVRADNLGPAAAPMLSIYDSCHSPLSAGHPQQLEWIAPTDKTYYFKLENHNPDSYGPATHYDLLVTTLGCDGDPFEFDGGDDGPATARLIAPKDPPETHNICPAGDEDWVRFEAAAGMTYVIETFNLGLDADPLLCLYEADGQTEIGCDDDGTGTKAARLIWTCPADGTYLVQARHYDPATSGPTTRYDLGLAIGMRLDGFEPDDDRSQASPISTDGLTQTHNFSPDQDDDWVKFSVTPGQYAIQTTNLAPGCDTVLQLYDSDGVTLLAENDDFTFGLSSLITHTFSSAGQYFASVRNFQPGRFGATMQYELLVVRGTPLPVATPTPIPTPTPPPAPPPSTVKTLILVNRERIRALYGPEQATQLLAQLHTLASHPRVLGNVILVETDLAVASAYQAWLADPLDTNLANDVSSAVRNLILSYLDKNPNVAYIVLVGNDQVIPFRRTPDRTSHPESHYQVFVSYETTLWAACGDDMSLTDSFYADQEPTIWEGRELYVPDYAIGRLIETPPEIMATIDLFLDGYALNAERALVTGYDFVIDAANAICQPLQTDLGSAAVDCTLIGETWAGDLLRERQLAAEPRFDLQSINGHANFSTEGAPQTPNVRAAEVAVWGEADLSRALIYTLGCHSGFNDVGPSPGGLDLAQAFTQRGASYIGNTGYGWGLGSEIGLSEQLMLNLTRALLEGGSTTIGQALTEAKQRYYAEAPSFDEYDEKILIEATLYGLPMLELYSGAALAEDPFPSVVLTTTAALPLNGLVKADLAFSLARSFASLEETQLSEGRFFDLDGHAHRGAGEPIQPKFFAGVSRPGAGRAHGVLVTGGAYTDSTTFDPVVTQPLNEYVSPGPEPVFDAPGWYPPQPFRLHRTATISQTETLVTSLGQYHSRRGQERLYEGLTFEVIYTDSYDWWEPRVLSVNGVLVGRSAQLKVEAFDGSGIAQVVAAYTDGAGVQLSRDLDYDPVTEKWLGLIPASAQTVFYVQVVDGAGNVTVANNKGAWYSLEAAPGGPGRLFLPLILKMASAVSN